MFTDFNLVIDFCNKVGLTSKIIAIPFWDVTYNGSVVTACVLDNNPDTYMAIDFDKLPEVFKVKPNEAYKATNIRTRPANTDTLGIIYSIIDNPDYVENNDPVPETINLIFIDKDPDLSNNVHINTTILVIGDDVYYNFNGVQVNVSEAVRNGRMSANEVFELCGIVLKDSKFSKSITQAVPAIIPPAAPEQPCVPDQIDSIPFYETTDLAHLLSKNGTYATPTYLSYEPETLIPIVSDANPIDFSNYTERDAYLLDPPRWCLTHNYRRWLPESSMKIEHGNRVRPPFYKLSRLKLTLDEVKTKRIRKIFLKYNFQELYSQMRCHFIDNFGVSCLKVILEGIDYIPDSESRYEPYEYTAYVAVYESHHTELVEILKQYMEARIHGFDNLSSFTTVYVSPPVDIEIEYFDIPNCTLTLADLVAIIPSDENSDNVFEHWEWSGLDDGEVFGSLPIRYTFDKDWAKYTSTSRGYAVQVIYEKQVQEKIEDILPNCHISVDLVSYTTFVKFNLFSRTYGYSTVIEEKIIYPRKVYLDSVEIVPDYIGRNGYSSVSIQSSVDLNLVYFIDEDTLTGHNTGYKIVFYVKMNDAVYPNMNLRFNFIDSSGFSFSYISDEPLVEVDLGLMRNSALNIRTPSINIDNFYLGAGNDYVRNLYYVPNNA